MLAASVGRSVFRNGYMVGFLLGWYGRIRAFHKGNDDNKERLRNDTDSFENFERRIKKRKRLLV